MKHKILLAAAICFAVSIIPHYASAVPIVKAIYYGYGDVIRLTSNTPTELLKLHLPKGEGNLWCVIEATGYVKTETSGANFKVWLQVGEGSQGGEHSNGSEFATDEEVSRRFVKASSGTLQSSFHTSMVVEFLDCCQDYDIRLMGTNFSGSGSLYVNYHGITATCYDKGYNEVTVLHPGGEIYISGYVYKIGGRTPFPGVKITGFPNGSFVVTDSTGFYAHEVPKGWSGTLKLCGPDCFTYTTGSPLNSRTYTNVTSTLTDQNWKQVLSLVPCAGCP